MGRQLSTRAAGAADGGFTLIELMITLAVAMILLTLAAPSFQSALNRHRLNSAASELAGALQLARSEAIRHNRRVTLCNSSDGSACNSSAPAGWSGWIVFVDLDANGVRGSTEPVVKAGTLDGALRATASSNVAALNQRVTFRGDGIARAADGQTLLNGTLAVCLVATQPPENARDVSLASGSRTAIKQRNGGGLCGTPGNT